MPVLSTALTRVASRRVITRREAERAYDVEVLLDAVANEIAMEVERFVASDRTKELYWEVEYPASWWQHFKRDVLRPLTDNPLTPIGWWFAEKARAIQYKREDFRESYVTRICPHIEVPPGSPAHFEWLVDDRGFVE